MLKAFKLKRRKRESNPRAGSPDLLPFQGSPFGLLGISPEFRSSPVDALRHPGGPVCFMNKNLSSTSGEDGIRTHVPFRTNGFQDRLVMTASIPLLVLKSLLRKRLLRSKQQIS